jgi:hypothetical protein
MNIKHLALEFQKLKKIEKKITSPFNQEYYFVSTFYNTSKHKPESFYKPISKIFKFED